MDERDLNLTTLISGLLFVLLGVLFLLDRLGAIRLAPELVLPVLLIGLGIGVLLGGRRKETADGPPPSGGPPSEDHPSGDRPDVTEGKRRQSPDDRSARDE